MDAKIAAAQPVGLDPTEVQQQLSRILASKAFRQADRLKRFLTFIVNETMEGRAESLKEFTVGVEVFGKDRTFDARSDPIVRVQARRLRAQLERYYIEEAGPDELIIEVPKGAYVVVFKAPKGVQRDAAQWSASASLVRRNTVLVLPFADYSQAGDQKFFCAGLAEEIINKVTRVEAIRVVSAGASTAESPLDPREAGLRANAAIVVTGSVRKAGEKVRVTANLIDTASACYLWSLEVDRLANDVFTIQEEVAKSIAENLRTELAGGPHSWGVRPPTQNLAAYNFYVQGRYHLNQRTEEALRKAMDFFEKAIAEDSEFAQAYSGISDAYVLLGHYAVLSPAEVWTKAASNAAWAVLKDEHSAEAHTSLAHVKATQDWDWIGAEQEYRRAIALDPRYPTAHHWQAASLLAPMGRLDEARAEMLLAQALDPTSSIISRDLARIYYYMGDFEAALEQCDHTIELNPHFTPAYWMLGFVQESRGEFDEAFAALQRAMQLGATSPSIQAALGHCYAVSGKKSEALRILKELKTLREKRYVSPFDLALVHFGLRQPDQGFEWLTKAFQDRCFELILLNVDPRLKSLRSDRRYASLFAQLGLP